MDHKIQRLEWARRHQNRQLRHWQHVLFSDESRFLLHRADGRVRVRRIVGERFQEDCALELLHTVVVRSMFGVQSIMEVVAIWSSCRTTSTPTPTGGFWRQKWCHMLGHTLAVISCSEHDNAPPHRAIGVQDFLEREEIDQLDWPPYSPDMNPIEHCRGALDNAVRNRDVQPTTTKKLGQALTEEWAALIQRHIYKLGESVPWRIQEVVKARGGHTKYWLLFIK